uniref:BZIP domain-containing protein n=1 Tax=Panagrolaimus sp. JU765 TaxID=591449 RepID=A0AC34PV51_9BILA
MWPEYSPTNSSTSTGSYSPQTPTSNFFPSGFKNEADVAKIHQQHQLAFAQQFGAINFPFPTHPYGSISSTHTVSKRKPKPVPQEEKNQAYFERRSKNNESAKKSREQRRRKEEEKDARIQLLEAHIARLQHDNVQLRFQLSQYCPRIPSMTTATPQSPLTMPSLY